MGVGGVAFIPRKNHAWLVGIDTVFNFFDCTALADQVGKIGKLLALPDAVADPAVGEAI